MDDEPRADVGAGLGSYDVGIAKHTADLFCQGQIPLVFKTVSTHDYAAARSRDGPPRSLA
jgi:hypothetical protein